jgi:hypothetical protein
MNYCRAVIGGTVPRVYGRPCEITTEFSPRWEMAATHALRAPRSARTRHTTREYRTLATSYQGEEWVSRRFHRRPNLRPSGRKLFRPDGPKIAG